jgi:hypothetical protein
MRQRYEREMDSAVRPRKNKRENLSSALTGSNNRAAGSENPT